MPGELVKIEDRRSVWLTFSARIQMCTLVLNILSRELVCCKEFRRITSLHSDVTIEDNHLQLPKIAS